MVILSDERAQLLFAEVWVCKCNPNVLSRVVITKLNLSAVRSRKHLRRLVCIETTRRQGKAVQSFLDPYQCLVTSSWVAILRPACLAE